MQQRFTVLLGSVACALALVGCTANPKVVIEFGDGGADTGLPADSGFNVVACTQSSTAPSGGWQQAFTCRCTAGQTVAVGCAAGCGVPGACAGDPVLAVCTNTSSVSECSISPQNTNDDCSERCPAVTALRCPSSGTIVVLTRSYTAGQTYTCAPSITR